MFSVAWIGGVCSAQSFDCTKIIRLLHGSVQYGSTSFSEQVILLREGECTLGLLSKAGN